MDRSRDGCSGLEYSRGAVFTTGCIVSFDHHGRCHEFALRCHIVALTGARGGCNQSHLSHTGACARCWGTSDYLADLLRTSTSGALCLQWIVTWVSIRSPWVYSVHWPPLASRLRRLDSAMRVALACSAGGSILCCHFVLAGLG